MNNKSPIHSSSSSWLKINFCEFNCNAELRGHLAFMLIAHDQLSKITFSLFETNTCRIQSFGDATKNKIHAFLTRFICITHFDSNEIHLFFYLILLT